jgi:hypothetical protein
MLHSLLLTNGSISKLTLMNSCVPCVPPYAKSCNITDPPIIRQFSLIPLTKADFLTSSAHPKNRNSPRIPAKLRYMLLHPPQRSLLIQQPRIKHPLPLNLVTRQESKRTQLLIISLCSSPPRHKVFTHSVLNIHRNKTTIIGIHQPTQIFPPIPNPIPASMNVHKHG